MISYVITVYNEKKEIQKLLDIINSSKNNDEEIIVVHTYKESEEQNTKEFFEIKETCKTYANKYENFHFKNKFADLKNYANSLATKEYIFNFDADELVSKETLGHWRFIVQNNTSDLYYVPRINTVSGYTSEDVDKYNWIINDTGWINWPDYQPRIYQNNGQIKWAGNVHERLTGYKKAAALPQDPKLALIHHKDIERQRKQNELYENIIRH